MNDDAHAGVNGKGHRVGDGVVDVDEFHIKFAHLDHLASLYGDELGLLEQAVFLQLQLDEPRRQAGAVHRHIHLLENIGDGPDMVLVTMGDEKPPDSRPVLYQIGHVGDHQINAVHVPIGESHTAVHHNDLAAVFINRHILADLVKAAKRNDFHFLCQNFLLLFAISVKLQVEKCNRNRREGFPRFSHLASWVHREPPPVMYGCLFTCCAAHGAQHKYFYHRPACGGLGKTQNSGRGNTASYAQFDIVYHNFFQKYT